MKKQILAVIREIEKLLVFLTSKPFLIRIDCKGIPGYMKKNLLNMQAQGRLLRWLLWLNQFSFCIEYI